MEHCRISRENTLRVRLTSCCVLLTLQICSGWLEPTTLSIFQLSASSAYASESEPDSISADTKPPSRFLALPFTEKLALGGLARYDFYSASKRLDGVHNLNGLTLQPKVSPQIGSWADAKIEGRLTDQDLTSSREPQQARLLEAYANLYFGAMDVRIGKQNIPWGRADGFNPTDNLTPKDFTVLSAKDEEDRRTGTSGMRVNLYQSYYTLSLIWLPLFNPNQLPIHVPNGFQLSEDKRSNGDWGNQGFAARLDQTGGQVDWSINYYNGLNLWPVARPLSFSEALLIHTRINSIGADFATNVNSYGLRGEAAYVQTQNSTGTDVITQNPYATYVIGIDRNLTDDLNVNIQGYQRFVVNFHHAPAQTPQILRDLIIFNRTVNQQLDQYQGGFTGRIRATWFNKALEGEILCVWNLPRQDFYLRPMMGYELKDNLKLFVGADIFQGRRESYFGRVEPNSALFVEVRSMF